MKTVIVKTQADWDALPEKFDEFTIIRVYSDPVMRLVIKRNPENSSGEFWENSRGEFRENSRGVFWENSRGVFRENSSGVFRGNSRGEFWENSRGVFWGNSRGEFWENSSGEFWENSSGEFWENSSGEFWENSRGVFWENSRGVFRGNSSGVIYENAIIRVLSKDVVIEAWHLALVVCQECNPTIKQHGTKVTVVKTNTFRHTIKSFLEIYKPKKGRITLYKAAHPDTRCDFYTGHIKYEGVVACPDWNPDPEVECGGGLHLSPSVSALKKWQSHGLILECEVDMEDIVVYAADITKVRCRKVKIIGEYKP